MSLLKGILLFFTLWVVAAMIFIYNYKQEQLTSFLSHEDFLTTQNEYDQTYYGYHETASFAPRILKDDIEWKGSNFCSDFYVPFDDLQENVHHNILGEDAINEPIRNNHTIKGSVHIHEYHYYQVCVSQHEHHHLVEISLDCLGEGDANLYISSSISHPLLDDCTWLAAKVGSDSITIPTYTEDFMRDASKIIFIGVYGRTVSDYELTVNIKDVPNSEVLHRAALRGGQSLLPRDVMKEAVQR
mmetsp:Transcript_25159/g.32547  ORF Transcript_25159/g.32547 Transcript_25159/m.32547 type:complete len:243 (-) Transcript_25159:118-846(-)